MRVIVTGSRDWEDEGMVGCLLGYVLELADAKGEELTVVHGACSTGADRHASDWAWLRPGAKEEPHRADWRRYGAQAGPVRNKEMVDAGADLCLAFIGPCTRPNCFDVVHGSHGATNCANLARAAGIKTIRVESYA